MRAILYTDKLRLTEDLPIPSPAPGEALVRVLMAGVCNTDLELTRGYMGFKGVLGHEFVGVVEKCDTRPDLIGRRVVGEINAGCGKCDWCRRGLRNHCPTRTVLGILGRPGAMAEYLTLPAENLLTVPDAVTDEEAVFTEPLAAAFEILKQVHIKPEDRVLVMGDGKLGLLCALALHSSSPARVTLLGRHEDKLGIARSQGVRTALADALPPGRAFDIAIEATGRAEGFSLALKHVRPLGTIVLKSTVAQGSEMNLAPIVIDELTLIGSRCGPFAPALRALEEKRIDVRPLVTEAYPARDALSAFARATERGVLKVLIDFRI